jgi:hypothetical protein
VFSGLEALAEAEVSQFDFPVAEEDVLGLYVSVHDVVPVEHLECLQQLPEGLQGFFFGEGSFFFDDLVEVAPVAVLVDEVVVVPGLEVVLVPDYVLAGRNGRKGVDLVDSALFELVALLVFFDRNDLDRELAHLLGVYGPVDLAETALSHLLNQRIVINYFNHPISL